MGFKHRGTYIPQAPGKDPNSKMDYSEDWSLWLQAGETIAQSSWVIPDGLTTAGTSINGAKTLVWLTGGVVGQTYKITNRVTTDNPNGDSRIEDRSMYVRCIEK